ncbi:MAG: AmmeMemoRadiSam system protein B [Treponema sp.]|jgi:AmmeMemoRadiSam system protein B|nr:AmmeMemoRadiSam system protein B [Treponema sp.]
MKVRRALLPAGWYPRTREEIVRFLAAAREDGGAPAARQAAAAAAAPHAGWYYAGALAARAAAVLAEGAAPDTVVVLGGHLPAGVTPLFYLEDAVETPLGVMNIDTEMRDALAGTIGGAADRFADNTVEVLLPLVHHFFPGSRLLALRVPADAAAFGRGKALYAAAAALGRRIKVLASTDLTHYGFNYGFSPRGSGRAALEWMREVNDRRFIDAVVAGDREAVLRRSGEERSACSAGAVLAAMGYAAADAAGGADTDDAPPAVLLAYGTSADRAENGEVPDSFVGYGAFAWFRG